MHHMIFLCGNPVKIKGIPLIVIEFVKRVDVCHHTVIKPVLVRILHPVYCDNDGASFLFIACQILARQLLALVVSVDDCLEIIGILDNLLFLADQSCHVLFPI